MTAVAHRPITGGVADGKSQWWQDGADVQANVAPVSGGYSLESAGALMTGLSSLARLRQQRLQVGEGRMGGKAALLR